MNLRPSSANMWAGDDGCHGWLVMASQFEAPPQNEAAAEGTAAHHEAAEVLASALGIAQGGWSEVLAAQRTVAAGSLQYETQLYVADVLAACEGGGYVGIESYVSADNIHPHLRGKVDACHLSADRTQLTVWDLKYGYSAVPAVNNYQMLIYVAALLHPLNAPPDMRLSMRIVQPRGYSAGELVRSWDTTVDAVTPLIEQVRRNAAATTTDDAPLRSGSHCRYCVARHACPAAVEGGAQLYEASTEPLPEDMTPAQLVQRLWVVRRAAEQLKYLEAGVESELLTLARRGERIPGARVASDSGRTVWRDEKTALELGRMFGLDLDQHKPITPKQAIDAGLPAEAVQIYAKTNSGKQKIVPLNKSNEVFPND